MWKRTPWSSITRLLMAFITQAGEVVFTTGLTGYQVVSGYRIENIEQPTSEEITAAAQRAITQAATGTMAWDEEKGAFTANVEAGSYLVLVKGTGDTLYNPMIVSVDYTNANDAGTIDAGSVDAKTQFAYGNVTYAKSTTPTVKKTIVLENGSEVHRSTRFQYTRSRTSAKTIISQIRAIQTPD